MYNALQSRTFMLHHGTYFEHATYSPWQASRLASQRLVRLIQRHYLLILFIVLLPVMLSRIQPNPRAVVWSDAEGYYQYLPAVFILQNVHQLQPGSVWPYYNEIGEYVDKYTCGVALFEWPFFLMARFVSANLGYDSADYFNPVYCNAMAICGFSFVFFGLWFLRRSLRSNFGYGITLLVILSVFFGTNLFHYATKEMSISHSYSFFLFTVFLYLVPRWIDKPTAFRSFMIGVILGWIVLIRPTNVIIGLMLFAYDVYSWQALKERLRFLTLHLRQLVWMIPGGFLILLPQLLYWKEMTGKWIYYSYSEEGFIYWNQPRLLEVLFDVQNGLFLYSPLVLLMVIGAVYGLVVKKYQGAGAVIIFAVITYVFASWWTWWFGGAFGHRCYVEYYALLAFPLGGLYHYVSSRWPLAVRLPFYSLVLVLMVFSVRLSYLYTSIGGPWDGLDWRWNWTKYEWVLSHFFPAT
jgi:hypothetical protein